MGIEFAYSAETAFVTPILLGIGVSHKNMTMVWGLSPVFGFILSPILGTLSDRCRSSLGRRRPFIIGLSVLLFLGLLLVPYGENVGAWLGDTGEHFVNMSLLNDTGFNLTDYDFYRIDDEIGHVMNFKYAIIITIIGTILLDFRLVQ
jgi:solute carrier family 45 protein 1/2/4